MNKLLSQLGDLWNRNKGFIVLLSAIILFRASIADQYHVPTGSMIPTISIGDRILVNKLTYNIKIPFTNVVLFRPGEPQRGEIVVFEQPGTGTVMVKRLIGLPGDKVELKFGYVYVNGKPLVPEAEIQARPLEDSSSRVEKFKESLGEQNYTIQRMPERATFNILDFVVPEDHYFMLGDNRDNSKDSRYWGYVHRELLKGRAFRVFYNLNFNGIIPEFTWARTGKSLY